jgi:PEP-CTERM motif-containing protein
MWRKTNSGNSQGHADWQENFGEGMGAGGGSSGALPLQTGAPEPATLVLLMFAVAGWCALRRTAT